MLSQYKNDSMQMIRNLDRNIENIIQKDRIYLMVIERY